MAATNYTNQQDYLKFISGKSKKSCSCHGDCGCEKKEENCGCCPVGLVGVYDDKGQFLSCMTPNDAELYTKNTAKCQDGYVMLINNTTGEKLGCVSQDQYAALNEDINGAGPPIPPTGLGVGGGVILSGTGTVGTGVGGFILVGMFAPPNTTNQDVTWSSSNNSVATVDSNGNVLIIGPGIVTITVTSVENGSIQGSKTYHFVDSDIAPLGITVVGGSSVDVDATLQLYAIFDPLNTTDQRATWQSSDASKAAVDSNGLVTGFLEGNTTITAKSVADPLVSGTLIIMVTNNS